MHTNYISPSPSVIERKPLSLTTKTVAVKGGKGKGNGADKTAGKTISLWNKAGKYQTLNILFTIQNMQCSVEMYLHIKRNKPVVQRQVFLKKSDLFLKEPNSSAVT